MVRYLFYTIGDLTYQSPLVFVNTSGWLPSLLNLVSTVMAVALTLNLIIC